MASDDHVEHTDERLLEEEAAEAGFEGDDTENEEDIAADTELPAPD